jgi:hypothetical protein
MLGRIPLKRKNDESNIEHIGIVCVLHDAGSG